MLLTVGGRKGVYFPPEFLPAKAGLVGRTGAYPPKGLTQQGEHTKHGKAFQSQKNSAAGAILNILKNGQISFECLPVNHKTGSFHPVQIQI